MNNPTKGQYPVKDEFYELMDSLDTNDLLDYIKWLFDGGYPPSKSSYKIWESYK